MTNVQNLARKPTPDIISYPVLQAVFDAGPEALRVKLNALIDGVIADYETQSDLTTTRKLSATGDFTGTLNGGAITASDTGLATTVNAHLIDYVRNPAFGPATGLVNAYTFSAMPATALVDGMSVYLDNVIAANTGASTFNWSGSGAIAIKDAKGIALTAGKMPLNAIVGLRYNASVPCFQLLGEGSDVLTGNFVAGDLISGQSGYSNDPLTKITGTLALTGTALVGDIISGKTAYNTDAKTKITGTGANIRQSMSGTSGFVSTSVGTWTTIATGITINPKSIVVQTTDSTYYTTWWGLWEISPYDNVTGLSAGSQLTIQFISGSIRIQTASTLNYSWLWKATE